MFVDFIQDAVGEGQPERGRERQSRVCLGEGEALHGRHEEQQEWFEQVVLDVPLGIPLYLSRAQALTGAA
jgi:hypothetical protein